MPWLTARRWTLASVVCLAAGLSRNNGFLLSVLVAVEYLSQNGYGRHYWLRSILLLLPGMAGFLLYQGYLWALFGNPIYTLKIQSAWGRYVTWPWVNVWETVYAGVTGQGVAQNLFWRLIAWQELFYTGLFVLLGLASWRFLRLSLAVYLSLSVLLYMVAHGAPSVTALSAMPRYMLPLFPAYIVMAFFLQGRRWLWAVVVMSGIVLVFYTVWVGSGRWVA